MIALKIHILTTEDYYSLILIILCMTLKLKIFMKILVKIKNMFDFSNYSAKSKYYNDSKELAVDKMEE